MLELKVDTTEGFDEEKQEFVILGGIPLRFEHSLVSLSKWESKFEKPFLSGSHSHDEVMWYIQAMSLDGEIPPEVFSKISPENISDIQQYIDSKQTATWFAQSNQAQVSREVVTSELIYYWMTLHKIPFETQHWHLNRLITLIQVCNHKSSPPKKMNRREAAEEQRRLNRERLERYGTTG